MLQSRFVVTMGVVLSALPGTASAVCQPHFTPPDSSEHYAFMSNVVASMGYAKIGLDRFRDNKDSATNEVLYSIRLAEEDYGCAATLITRFTQSKYEKIRSIAEVLVLVYSTIGEANRAVWSDLVRALTQSCQTLWVSNGDGTAARRLRVTRAEREALKRDLVEIFGASVRKGTPAGQSYLEAAGAGLYAFLANPTVRSSDDR